MNIPSLPPVPLPLPSGATRQAKGHFYKCSPGLVGNAAKEVPVCWGCAWGLGACASGLVCKEGQATRQWALGVAVCLVF